MSEHIGTAPAQSPNVEYDVIEDAPEKSPQERILDKLRDKAEFAFLKAEEIVSLSEAGFANLNIEEIKYKRYLLSVAAENLKKIIKHIEKIAPEGESI